MLLLFFTAGHAAPLNRLTDPGVPDVTHPDTKLSVVANFAVANGIAKNSVLAHLVDSDGNPIASKDISFSINTSIGSINPVIKTDANGNALIELTSLTAGVATITATVDGKPITFGSPATITFVADVPDVTVNTTYIVVVDNNAIANGVATNKIKAHVTDAYGNLVSGKDVTFTISSGVASFTGSATVTTDANGDAFIELTSTVAGAVQVTAVVDSKAITNGSPATAIFVAGPPDPTVNSTYLAVTADNAAANGTATNTVKAHITDANGNPVVNAMVFFAISDGSGSFVGSALVTTNASGEAIISLTSTVAGTVDIIAAVNGTAITNGSPATVTFVADVPDVNNSNTFLIVTANNAIANGTATNSVKAHITDAHGNVVANTTVTFSISSGTGTFVGTATVTTDANGDATISLNSTVAGDVAITATVNGNAIINGSPATVTFIADVPDATNSLTALSVTADNAAANGSTTNTVQAHITDANGNPVPNATVTFAIASGTGTFTGTATVTTDANGNATISITSTVAGTVDITATVNGNTITNGSPATVTFVADVPDVTNSNTNLTVTADNAIANGTATNTVKAHVEDAYGNVVANTTVTFAITNGTGSFVGTATVTTDANGNASISVTSTVAGTVDITATVNGTTITNGSPATVTFVADVPDATNSNTSLTVTADNAVANGTTTNGVQAHITDANGNPVANATVIFAIANGTGNFVGTTTVTTDANGNATISLTSTVAGTVDITATVNGTAITNGSPATVTFVADVPDVTSSNTNITVTADNAVANGTATNTVKAHIEDANGNPVPNTTVTFAIVNGTGTFVGTATVTTDANGNASINITSTVAGTVDITATVNGTTITNGSPATVTFVADVPDATNSNTSLTVTADNAIANGTATNSVQAHITDANGNPVANTTVTFAIANGTGSFVGTATVTTDANGNATISLTSTVAGTVDITATVNGNTITNGSPATVTFVADVPDAANSNTSLTVTADNAIANGTATNTVKAHVTDANGNPVANTTVTFAIASGNGTFVGTATVTTDANGNASINITSTVAGTVDITATVNGTAITNGSPATVTFVADVPDATNSNTSLTVTADNAIANGTATNTVKAHIEDANGNPVPNTTVTFAIVNGTGVFVGTATATTDANGDASINITSTVAGTVDITATVNGNTITNGSPATVTFVADAPDAGNSNTSLTVTVDNAIANGTATNSVKAHVTDANGNPVANATVTFAIANGTGTFTGTATVTTDANGDATISITSTVAGTVDITATVNGTTITNGSPATVTFVADVPDAGSSNTSLTVTADNAIANGVATNSVLAHITDANGNPVANASVTFAIANGSGSFVGTVTVTTNANGDASISLTSTFAGVVDITATVNGLAITNGSPAMVTFVADSPDTGNAATSLSVVDNYALANGAATNSVQAHIADAHGNPVANATVTFAITSGTGTFVGTATVTTDASGNATITLTSTVVGDVTITADVNGTPITNGSPATVTFVPGSPDVSNSNTLLSVVADNAIANGTTTNTVKAHIEDDNGHPIPNQTIVFTISNGTASFTGTATLTTDANGDAIISLTSTVAGTVDITATVAGIPIVNGSPATVTFVADVPDAGSAQTALSVVANNAIADGVATNSVQAHVTDANGNPVANATVTFAITSGTGSIVGTATVTTDAAGNAVINLTSTVIGDVTLTADVNGTPITNGSPATVTFIAGIPDVSNTNTQLSVVADNAVADGVATNTVQAHIEDVDGHPVANQTIVFTISNGTASFTGTATVITDANGNATISLTSTVAGTVDITATVEGTPIVNGSPATVTFVAGSVDTGSDQTALSVVDNNALANNAATNSVQAHITDAQGNPVANATVTFTIADGTASFTGDATIVTDANGNALITLTSAVAGNVSVTATVDGNTITNGSPAMVTFVADPDVHQENTRLIVVINNALADGVATNSVKAHIADGFGNSLKNQNIYFSIKSGEAQVLTVQPVITDANGDAYILLSSTAGGEVTVTAKVDETDILNGSPAKLRFVPIDIHVPKVFTPNNDGVNDVLKPIMTGVVNFTYFNIYNRWGNLIFTTNNPNVGWDGRYHGVLQPVETYIWIVEGTDKDGKKILRKGMVSLVR